MVKSRGRERKREKGRKSNVKKEKRKKGNVVHVYLLVRVFVPVTTEYKKN